MDKQAVQIPRITIVTGHYGSGKTNVAINLAIQMRDQGLRVALVDLDIVNPYFRSADFADLARRHDIELVAMDYANSNVDLPSMPGDIYSVFNRKDRYVILDVGGDDAGAVALGQYARLIGEERYRMLYVINRYRYWTQGVDDTVELMRAIEAASRLRVTELVNNSHLAKLTTAEDIKASFDYAGAIERETGVPLTMTTIREDLCRASFGDLETAVPVKIYVRTPWDEPAERPDEPVRKPPAARPPEGIGQGWIL